MLRYSAIGNHTFQRVVVRESSSKKVSSKTRLEDEKPAMVIVGRREFQLEATACAKTLQQEWAC